MTFPIRRKILLALGLIALLVLLVAGLSINALTGAQNRFDDYVHNLKAQADAVETVRTAVDRLAIAARNMALVTTAEDVAKEHDAEAQAQDDVDHNLARLQDLAARPDTPPEARALVDRIAGIEQRYKVVANHIVDLALAGQHDQAVASINTDCRPLLAALVAATGAYADDTHRREEALIASMAEESHAHRAWLIGLSTLALLVASGIGLWLAQALTRPIVAAVSIARTVAAGDLTSRIEVRGNDETRDLLDALHGMNERLTQTVRRVRDSSDHVETAAREIAAGNTDLSRRTEAQAVALQQAATSMDDLTRQVRENTEAAQQAHRLASDASGVAVQGRREVEEVVNTMQAIDERSTKIADITGIIESIAFQTNILALNAAVEAARAGEQGRGFAVVAGEVRNLAQRSDSAAKEIKDLIARSVDSVRQGTGQAGVARQTMSKVTDAITAVTTLMEGIANASTEQTHGLEQINQTIGQMDGMTQQNTALVEQAAAASRSLEDQGHELNQAVGVFRL